MKKGWWIFLCIIFSIANIYMSKELRELKKGRIFIKGYSIPNKKSLLTLVIYFEEKSCITCMGEYIYWNKLYNELKRNQITIVGVIPEGEDINKINAKYKLLFPLFHDKKRKILNTFHIPIIPFKILLDKKGNILYMSPVFFNEVEHESFYFAVLELLEKIEVFEKVNSKKN